MANSEDTGEGQGSFFAGPAEPFHTGPDINELLESHAGLRETLSKQGLILAEHQGKFTGIFPSISAVQSSLGAWLSVVAVVTTMILGLLIFSLNRTSAVGDRIGGVEVRLSGLEGEIEVLPERVARELRDQPSGPVEVKR